MSGLIAVHLNFRWGLLAPSCKYRILGFTRHTVCFVCLDMQCVIYNEEKRQASSFTLHNTEQSKGPRTHKKIIEKTGVFSSPEPLAHGELL